MDRAAIEAEITGMLGAVPGWLKGMDDDCLASQWDNVKFVMGDTSLAGRDKALVSFGAAVTAGCQYWIPFHKAQLELNGFTEAQITDAARVCAVGANFTAYFHGIQYPVDTFKDELAAAVEHIKSNA